MGFRFRRSVRLLPGVRLNLGTRGISTSLGGRGATLNLGRRGARATLGIPGTGLSYSTRLSGAGPAPQQPATGGSIRGWIAIGVMLLLVISCIAGTEPEAAAPSASQELTAPALPTRTIAAQNVNCRAQPSTSGQVLARLDKGLSVRVIDQTGVWTKIARIGGDCWISNTLLNAL